MTDPDLALVLELLKQIQSDVRDLKHAVQDLTRRVGRMEQSIAALGMGVADESVRLDRLTERVARIEIRLNLEC